ncbi:MAG: DNA recombination protein RmuC [bacterium]|nr:DNA recombination protein RmuC [bacterium]
MELLVASSVALVIGFGVGVLLLRSKSGNDTSLTLIQQELHNLRKTVDDRMNTSSTELRGEFQRQFDQSVRIVREVTEQLTKLDETNRQVVSFADQLQSLQDILKNPKQRGILGEYYLETLLKNVLPPGSYQMQYPMQNGTIVDAAVFVKDKVIPIDSKFSLENYNRLAEEKNQYERIRLEKVFVSDLKDRINETAKYIQPAEGTMDFAFMFIPHEAIYYDLLVNKIGALKGGEVENLIQRAAGKHNVIIVSPTSFSAYLQTVLQGLRAMQIEDTAKDIVKRVGELGKHIKIYEDYYAKMGTSLRTTVNHYNSGYKELNKIDKDVMHVTGERAGIEVALIDRPELDLNE